MLRIIEVEMINIDDESNINTERQNSKENNQAQKILFIIHHCDI